MYGKGLLLFAYEDIDGETEKGDSWRVLAMCLDWNRQDYLLHYYRQVYLHFVVFTRQLISMRLNTIDDIIHFSFLSRWRHCYSFEVMV